MMRSVRSDADEPVLSIRGLVTEFETPDGILRAVDGVSYEVYPGETLGVVGESGSGKSVTVMSLLGLIPQPPGRIVSGEVMFADRDLLALSPSELRHVRGREVAMIFQDPMTSLNPVIKVGSQIAEALLVHSNIGKELAKQKAIDLLDQVGVPNPTDRFHQYPHEYSGGMRQRAMIAMAMANKPRLLIADEPTTALDVTIQAQVMKVLKAAQEETNAATILITHDLGLIAETANRVVVMYGGRVVETGDVEAIFGQPQHPYTLGLLSSLPRLDTRFERLEPIPGTPPNMISPPSGCAFHPRCRLSRDRPRCVQEVPVLTGNDEGAAACHFSDEMVEERARVEERIGSNIGGR